MKRISVCMLILCLLISGSCPIISSAAPEADITAEMNYLTNTIDVEYTNSQDYDAYVAIYITKSVDGGSPMLSDIVKMDKALCKSGATVSFSFKCDENILTDTYDVYAVLSGSHAIKSKVVGGVLIVSTAERDSWLREINNAPETAALPDLAVADMIYSKIGAQMGYTYPESWKNTYIMAIKRDDYNNEFTDFSKVTDAWTDSDKIYAMRQSATSEALAELIDSNGIDLGLDINNKDYKNHKLAFAAMFKSLIDTADSKSRDSIGKQFKKSSAITAINERDVDGKAKALTEYKDELKINELHNRIVKAGAVNVARLLDGFKGLDIESISSKVLSALQKVEAGSRPTEPESSINSGNNNNNSYNGVSVPSNKGGAGDGSYVPAGKPGIKKFIDVAPDHWAKNYIEELAADGIINGYVDGSFRAENVVSREELVQMIVKSFALSGNSNVNFNDIADDFWAKSAIETAIACGIIYGVKEDEFGVGRAVTRQDVAVMVDRSITYLKHELDQGEMAFKDSDDVADYAKDSISRLTAAGLLSGFEDGTFLPREALTRAQVAKILCLARKLVQ